MFSTLTPTWWLRSPGRYPHTATYVRSSGHIAMDGSNAFHSTGGIRPALWLNLNP